MLKSGIFDSSQSIEPVDACGGFIAAGTKKHSDTGNRTPGYRVRGDNVSHYTISDL